jgi:acetyl esterase/lipase
VRGLFIAGERDELTRQGQERVAAALNARGVLCDLQVVPGMAHGYPDDLGLRVSGAMPFLLATKR